ncbi:Beta-glucosidase BoGH3B [Phytophthora ramorum]|uniref:Beta-glucosidase BoGH3B n=2 Tax=Phytophthora ramorum TaxID=164328 RepID=UPI0030B02750|nr:Beta-glucosidase BoGH3B [Phytophthora ramorum]
MLTKWLLLTAAVLQSALASSSGSSDALDSQAQTIVDGFSTDQVIGQMCQLDISMVLNDDNSVNETLDIQTFHMDENGGHPMVYGLDSVHGAQYVDQAVMFPQQINAGASFNPELVRKMGYVTGRDTAAAGAAYIQGVQNNSQSGACMKHFIGYSQTVTGVDREGVTISDYDLLNYHVPSFKAGIEHGAMSTMENYISVNGVPVVSSTKILNNLLRNDLDFDGVVVTDWGEVNNLQSWHRVVSTQQAAVELVIANTSLDMTMVPYSTDFIDQAKYVLSNNSDYEARLRASAKRIVKMKLDMGLYDTPVPGADNVALVGNDDDLAEALDLARESIVLLKNDDNILPLTNSTSVFLTGFSVDDIGYQCGGWSIYWQGTSGNDYFAHGMSVKEGIENLVGSDSVTYFNGLSDDGTYSDEDLSTAVGMASDADVIIAAIGEAPYAEKWGDIDVGATFGPT